MALDRTILLVPNVEIEIRDAAGELLEVRKTHNIVTSSGLNQLRNLVGYPAIAGTGFTPQYIAIGSSDSTPSLAQTDLVAEVFRKEITRRLAEGDDKLHLQLYVDTTEANGGGTQALRECGLFSNSSAGLLWARATYTQINKTSAISVTFNWRFTFANG